jgi:hypothetical protein
MVNHVLGYVFMAAAVVSLVIVIITSHDPGAY